MVKGLSVLSEPKTFQNIVKTGKCLSKRTENLKNIPLEQKDIILRSLSEDIDPAKPEITQAYKEAITMMEDGKLEEGFELLKPFKPNEAAIKETSLGTAVMAKGWAKPVIFPKEGDFKFVGWAD